MLTLPGQQLPTLFPYTTLFRSEPRPATLELPPLPTVTPTTRAPAASTPATPAPAAARRRRRRRGAAGGGDRKSTRLNSSHVKISYAVFCLKKKKSYFKPRFGEA